MDTTTNSVDQEVFKVMLNNDTAYKLDCKFIVGSDPDNVETIFGCKYLFAIESPVFERLIFGDFQESQNLSKGIPLPDDCPKALRHFRLLACCSSERLSRMSGLNLDETLNLAKFCHKYMALSISNLCIDRLATFCQKSPSIELIIKIFDCIEMFPTTSKVYVNVFDELDEREYPLVEVLNDLNPDSFKKYIHNKLDIMGESPKKLYYAVFTTIEEYLQHNDLIPKTLLDDKEVNELIKDENSKPDEVKTQNTSQDDEMKRTFLRDILKGLNFSISEKDYFFDGPHKSNILTLEQKYYILTSICQLKSEIYIN